MVRACTIGIILFLCGACTEANVADSGPENLSAPAAITTVLTKKGIGLLNSKLLQEVTTLYPEGYSLAYGDQWTAQGISMGEESGNVFLEFEAVSVAAPAEDTDNIVIPAQFLFKPFTLLFDAQNADSSPCTIDYTISDLELSFGLLGGKTKARTFAFSVESPTSVYTTFNLQTTCTNDVTEVFPSDISPQVTEWLAELISETKGVLTDNLGLDIVFAGSLDRAGMENTNFNLAFGVVPGGRDDALSSRGGWLNLDLDLHLESDRHESSPPFPGEEKAIEVAPPLQASDLSTNTENPPFSYAVLMSRQAIQQTLWHALHSGHFYQREQPLSVQQDNDLLNALPGAIVAEAEAMNFSYSVQAFSYPEVHFGTEGSESVVRVFFPHIRADLNQIIDGAHVRLITVDTAASFSFSLEFTSELVINPKVQDVNVTGHAVRSPLWGAVESGGPFAKTLLRAIGEQALQAPIFLPVNAPMDMLIEPIDVKVNPQEHLVFTFFMGIDSGDDD